MFGSSFTDDVHLHMHTAFTTWQILHNTNVEVLDWPAKSTDQICMGRFDQQKMERPAAPLDFSCKVGIHTSTGRSERTHSHSSGVTESTYRHYANQLAFTNKLNIN
jgi:hypothetical protein